MELLKQKAHKVRVSQNKAGRLLSQKKNLVLHVHKRQSHADPKDT